jgi:uncharacterized protein GlcG (DUF336 family)
LAQPATSAVSHAASRPARNNETATSNETVRASVTAPGQIGNRDTADSAACVTRITRNFSQRICVVFVWPDLLSVHACSRRICSNAGLIAVMRRGANGALRDVPEDGTHSQEQNQWSEIQSRKSTKQKGSSMKTALMFRPALYVALALSSQIVIAGDDNEQNSGQRSGCKDLPTHDQLAAALKSAVDVGGTNNAGFGLNMWATVVNRDGEVCAVAFTGQDRGDQWPGSRVISAQKANTANAFSLPRLALSTANLYTAVQPGGTLYGLQHSNPVDTDTAYRGPSRNYGQSNDPMVGRKIGGVNVFGGGLGLYNKDGKLVGAVGVSGDTSCTDHIVAWKLRKALKLDYVPAGVSPTGDDNIVHDPTSGWFHPDCGAQEKGIAEALPVTNPISH